MPNVPPDGWESAVRTARDGIAAARADLTATRVDLDELRDRLGPPGAGLPRQLTDLRAALDALTARVDALEQPPPVAEPPTT